MPVKKSSAKRGFKPLSIDHYTCFPGGWTSFPIETAIYERTIKHLQNYWLNAGGAYDSKETFSLIHAKATIDEIRKALEDFDPRAK